MAQAAPLEVRTRAGSLTTIVPNDLQGLLRLLEEACGQEEKWKRLRLSNGHLIRLAPDRRGDWRLRYGFSTAEVLLETPATEKAVIAALAALKGKTTKRPIDMRYAVALSEGVELARSGEIDTLKAFQEELSEDPRLEGAKGRNWHDVSVVQLLEALLREYRPEFNDLPQRKRTALIEQAANHLTTYLEALRRFTTFLESGDPTAGIPKTKLKITQEQLQAAQLCDVVGLSHREIGTALGLKLNEADQIQGGHQKAKERVREGRKLLCEAIGGEESYWRYVEQEKREAQRWNSLTTEERWAEEFGADSGIPADSMLIIMTGDLEAAKAEVAKLGPEKAADAASARATWQHWSLSSNPGARVTLRAGQP